MSFSFSHIFPTFYLHDQNRIVAYPWISRPIEANMPSSYRKAVQLHWRHFNKRKAPWERSWSRQWKSKDTVLQLLYRPDLWETKRWNRWVLGANFGMSRNQMHYESFLPSWMKHETLKLTHDPWIPLFGGPSVAHRSTWTWLDSCSQDWKWKTNGSWAKTACGIFYLVIFDPKIPGA